MHPALSNDKLLLNELIREYLDFSGYRNTLSVFLTETGQPAERLRRDVVASQLNIPIPETTIPGHASSGSEIPLLYGLLTPDTENNSARAQQKLNERFSSHLDKGPFH